MSPTTIFFRNDDVNRFEPGLVAMTDLLNRHGATVSHAVEPANLADDVRDWLLEKSGQGVEIVQHGYSHQKHHRGEFGGTRSRSDQKRDLRRGLEIMEDSFGEDFFRAMSFPFGSYNLHTIPLLDELGYQVVSCHWRHQFSRQVFYALGRRLGKGRWLDRHISHHLRFYPGTRVREISVTMAPIKRYLKEIGPCACEFHDLDHLKNVFQTCRRRSPVVGIVLHHRFRGDQQGLDHLERFLEWVHGQPGVQFSDIAAIHSGLEKKGQGIEL